MKFVIALFFLFAHVALSKRAKLEPSGPAAKEAASFALERLRGLSSYYTDLEQVAITKAETEKGVFHDNTFLDVTYRVQGKESNHEVMVMKHLETGQLSFAIDEFPEVELDERDKDPYAHYTEVIILNFFFFFFYHFLFFFFPLPLLQLHVARTLHEKEQKKKNL